MWSWKFFGHMEEIKLKDYVVTYGTEHLTLALGHCWCFLSCYIVDSTHIYKNHNHCLGKGTFK